MLKKLAYAMVFWCHILVAIYFSNVGFLELTIYEIKLFEVGVKTFLFEEVSSKMTNIVVYKSMKNTYFVFKLLYMLLKLIHSCWSCLTSPCTLYVFCIKCNKTGRAQIIDSYAIVFKIW